tara:strand:- start:8500 stop:9336 length:837 start_codon:yes stop_codon:yes gene_type:complete
MAYQYYYLVAGLPDIVQDEPKLSVSRKRFKDECREQVHPNEFEQIKKLFCPDDNYNLYNVLLRTDKEFKKTGNYTLEELEEEIRSPESLPGYLTEFIDVYKNATPIKPGMSWENQLIHLFYGNICNDETFFIRSWFLFEFNLKNILTCLNSRKHGTPLENEIIGDDFVAQNLKKSNERYFGLSKELDYIEPVINLFEHKDVLEREKGIDQLKWDYLDELTTFKYFSVEVLMSFLIKLGITERWIKLDKETGKTFLNKMVNELRESFVFPEEYVLSGRK